MNRVLYLNLNMMIKPSSIFEFNNVDKTEFYVWILITIIKSSFIEEFNNDDETGICIWI